MRQIDQIENVAGPKTVLASSVVSLNPDAYMAAWLEFQNLLPDHLSADLPEAVYNAVAFHLANPVPVASYEYMQAFVNLSNAHIPVHNLSLTALDHITPDVTAYMLAQLVAPVPPAPHF